MDDLLENSFTPCRELQPLLVKFIKMKRRRRLLDGMSLSRKSEAPGDVEIDNVRNLLVPCPMHPVDILLDYILKVRAVASGGPTSFQHPINRNQVSSLHSLMTKNASNSVQKMGGPLIQRVLKKAWNIWK